MTQVVFLQIPFLTGIDNHVRSNFAAEVCCAWCTLLKFNVLPINPVNKIPCISNYDAIVNQINTTELLLVLNMVCSNLMVICMNTNTVTGNLFIFGPDNKLGHVDQYLCTINSIEIS